MTYAEEYVDSLLEPARRKLLTLQAHSDELSRIRDIMVANFGPRGAVEPGLIRGTEIVADMVVRVLEHFAKSKHS